jgi:hypothetical protein
MEQPGASTEAPCRRACPHVFVVEVVSQVRERGQGGGRGHVDFGDTDTELLDLSLFIKDCITARPRATRRCGVVLRSRFHPTRGGLAFRSSEQVTARDAHVTGVTDDEES